MWGLAMLRAIVLVLCLASAGGIAAYSLSTRGDKGEPVYTVPSPSAPAMLKAGEPRRVAPDNEVGLVRELQRELKRVGCYNGEISGVWTTSSRLAMKTFLDHVNAALPIDKADPVLFSLVQSHRERACGIGCPEGQTAQVGGACVPGAVAAAGKEPLPPEAKPEAGKTGGTAAAAAAGAAAGMALAAPGAVAKQDAKVSFPEAAAQTAPASAAPPDGKAAKRPRRSAQTPQPPKLVRDFMKALGIK
jgi:hypothetical protein